MVVGQFEFQAGLSRIKPDLAGQPLNNRMVLAKVKGKDASLGCIALPNAYRCQLFDLAGQFFAAHIVEAATLAQAIELCECRMKAEATAKGCVGFEIWQGGKRVHRVYDSTGHEPPNPKIIAI